MKHAKTLLLTAALICIGVIAGAYAAGLFNFRLPISGTVRAVGVNVYGDAVCTQPLTAINWGLVSPGETVNKALWIRNNGTAPVTLSLSTANFNPAAAETYMTLSWNYAGQTLQPGDVAAASLSLMVHQNIQDVTAFSFDCIITASE